MFNHIVQECARAQDQSWHFFGGLISQHFTGFFRDHGNIDLCEVKQKCLHRFQRLIIDVCNHRKQSAVTGHLLQHYAHIDIMDEQRKGYDVFFVAGVIVFVFDGMLYSE